MSNGYDPLAFHQPERLFAVRTNSGLWLRSGKGGRPVLNWDPEPTVHTFITADAELAHDVADFCRLVEETAHVTEIVAESRLRQ